MANARTVIVAAGIVAAGALGIVAGPAVAQPYPPAYPAYPQGYPAPSYPPPSYPQSDPAPAYPPAYQQPAYPQTAYPQPAYPRPAYPQPAYPQPGYPQSGYPAQPGYQPPGYAPPQASVPAPSLNPPPAPPGVIYKRPGNDIGTGQSLPTSGNSSNINSADTRSAIAPRLPNPDVGPDAPPAAFLRDARAALAAGRTGQAQEALERAETRSLDRSVPYNGTNAASGRPLVQEINAALQALGTGDRGRTIQLIDAALANPEAGAAVP